MVQVTYSHSSYLLLLLLLSFLRVTLPILVPRQEANYCRKNSKKLLSWCLKIAHKVKMEASVCRQNLLEATACRKYKCSLSGFALEADGTNLDMAHAPDTRFDSSCLARWCPLRRY